MSTVGATAPAAPAGPRAAAPVVCVCGLHGGAGTTTAAVLLAEAAAARSRSGEVALIDADPSGGGLALHLGAATPTGLHELVEHPAGAWVDHRGARLIAPAPGLGAAARPEALAAVLDELAASHRLLVLDAGPVGAPHAQLVLERADLVLWSVDATTSLRAAGLTLASSLTRAARHAPWALVAHATGREGLLPPAAELAQTVPGVRGLVLIARQAGAPADGALRERAGLDLLELLA